MAVRIINNQVHTHPAFCGSKAKKLANRWRRQLKHIELTPNSPVSDTFIQGRATDIESLGKVGKKIINKQNLKFPLAQKTTDAFPEFKGQCPTGWPEGSTWDDTDAIYVCYEDGSNKIGLFEKPTKNSAAKADSVRHEVGHQGSKMFFPIIGCYLTDLESFTDAYLKDIRKLPQNFKNFRKKVCKKEYFKRKKNNKFESKDFKDYINRLNKWFEKKLNFIIQGSTPQNATEWGKDEAIAEIFAMLSGGSGCEDKDKLYQAVFPNTTAYVEKLRWLLDKK